MKLARVLAKHPRKLADTVNASSDALATSSGSAGERSKFPASFSDRTASDSDESTGRCAHLGMHALPCQFIRKI